MKLIVNADDFGMSHEKNIAIDEMMRNNICTNASLVVNMPYTQEAISLAYSNGYKDKLSLHINLTVGESISGDIRNIPLYYENGKFAYRPIIKLNAQIYPKHIQVLRAEIEAQIVKFQEYGLNLNSIDSHNWVHLRLPIWIALKPLIKKYDIKIVRPMWDGYKRPEIASQKWSQYFRLFSPILLKCPQCKILGHTSNIEQFLLNKENIKEYRYVEVFTHPDIVERQVIDVSSSYLKKPRETVVHNVKLIKEYETVTVNQVLEEMKYEKSNYRWCNRRNRNVYY